MRRVPVGAQKNGTGKKSPEKPPDAAPPVPRTKRPAPVKQKRSKTTDKHAGKNGRSRGRRKRKRRGSKILYYLMFGILAFSILFILSITVFFRIDTIRVTGDEAADQEAIIAQSEIRTVSYTHLRGIRKNRKSLPPNAKKSPKDLLKFWTAIMKTF